MCRNEEFGDQLMYSKHENGAIPAAHLYHDLYRQLPHVGWLVYVLPCQKNAESMFLRRFISISQML